MANNKSIVHLICGSTGAGKTTYANGLAKNKGAIKLILDEWMQDLFGADFPDPIYYEWAIKRVERCEDHALKLCKQLIAKNQEVIFDFGFFKYNQREKIRTACIDFGAEVKLHYLQVDPEIRWERVEHRNKIKGDTYSLDVTRGMFDFCEDLFEELNHQEVISCIVIKN